MRQMEESFKKLIEKKINEIKEDKNIRENSKKIFFHYLESKLTEGITYSRVSRIVYVFWYILKNFNFDFSALTQEQANKIWIWLSQQESKEWTKYTNLRIFKSFVKWLNENYDAKIKTKDWKVKKPKNSLMPEYLINEEEFNKLINATDDIQERLLIGLLY